MRLSCGRPPYRRKGVGPGSLEAISARQLQALVGGACPKNSSRTRSALPNGPAKVNCIRCGQAHRGGKTMTMYLSRFSYTPETWARLTQNPEDRRKAARSYIESVGGKLHRFWYAFGEHDGWNLREAPDNVSMVSVMLAIGAGGARSSSETTVLLSVE